MTGSAYARWPGRQSRTAPRPSTSAREVALQAFIREAIGRGLVASAQDVSGGGLAVALAEGAMWGGLGAHVRVAVGDVAGRRAVRREPVAGSSSRARPGSRRR